LAASRRKRSLPKVSRDITDTWRTFSPLEKAVSYHWGMLVLCLRQAQAVKEVVAWQLAEAMKKKKISKNKMATLLKTSRTQVDRLLSAKDDITLSSLQRAAAMVGRRVTIELV
jgi:hypothetical protein